MQLNNHAASQLNWPFAAWCSFCLVCPRANRDVGTIRGLSMAKTGRRSANRNVGTIRGLSTAKTGRRSANRDVGTIRGQSTANTGRRSAKSGRGHHTWSVHGKDCRKVGVAVEVIAC